MRTVSLTPLFKRDCCSKGTVPKRSFGYKQDSDLKIPKLNCFQENRVEPKIFIEVECLGK